MKFGVVQFPGSNCDQDAHHALSHVLGRDTTMLWHKNDSTEGCDAIVLPGGFSYGDYLRCGAIARFSPVMKAVIGHARGGGFVIGICNGFQILCEAGLLPGALVRNSGLHFVCRHVHIRAETPATPFTSAIRTGQVLRIPVAHGEGNYTADESTLDRLERNQQVVFRYCDRWGRTGPHANPNGAARDIAGVCNDARNVLGLMPHPERACERALGSEDGRLLFDSLIQSLTAGGAA